jgi:hypothetical protein
MAGLATVSKLAGETVGQEFLIFTLGNEEYGIDLSSFSRLSICSADTSTISATLPSPRIVAAEIPGTLRNRQQIGWRNGRSGVFNLYPRQ